jgi:hypothetical protein
VKLAEADAARAKCARGNAAAQRSDVQRTRDAQVFEQVSSTLASGGELQG